MSKLDDEIAHLERTVDQFAQVMKTKLKRKARQGYTGWDEPAMYLAVQASLQLHVERLVRSGDRRQAVDIANLAMMLWFMDWQKDVEGIAS